MRYLCCFTCGLNLATLFCFSIFYSFGGEKTSCDHQNILVQFSVEKNYPERIIVNTYLMLTV